MFDRHSSECPDDASELKEGLESCLTWLKEANAKPEDVRAVRFLVDAAFSSIVAINDICHRYVKDHPAYEGE